MSSSGASSRGSSPRGRDAPRRPRLPLLSHLLDSGSATPDGAAANPSEALGILREAVRRDLEALLNARRRRLRPDPGLTEVASSIVGYGIPDATSGAFAIDEAREALVRDVELTIRRFEPRLTNVVVTLLPDTDSFGRSLRMKVDAVLRADPLPEPVTFETLLEPVTRDVDVRET